MRKLRRLQQEARQSAAWRGHQLTHFVHDQPGHAHAHCRACEAGVWVESHPPANGIEIAGQAVAITCPLYPTR